MRQTMTPHLADHLHPVPGQGLAGVTSMAAASAQTDPLESDASTAFLRTRFDHRSRFQSRPFYKLSRSERYPFFPDPPTAAVA